MLVCLVFGLDVRCCGWVDTCCFLDIPLDRLLEAGSRPNNVHLWCRRAGQGWSYVRSSKCRSLSATVSVLPGAASCVELCSMFIVRVPPPVASNATCLHLQCKHHNKCLVSHFLFLYKEDNVHSKNILTTFNTCLHHWVVPVHVSHHIPLLTAAANP